MSRDCWSNGIREDGGDLVWEAEKKRRDYLPKGWSAREISGVVSIVIGLLGAIVLGYTSGVMQGRATERQRIVHALEMQRNTLSIPYNTGNESDAALNYDYVTALDNALEIARNTKR